MSDSIDFKYRAFLSYSHADTPLAKWLHARLERFPLRGLTGRATALGPVPKQLRPIFRDREDFSAGGSLNDQSIAALDASAALIVLCSPASAKSHYVNEEIRLFKHRHPERPVVPVILAGKPDNGVRECFPPALRFELDAGGQVTDQPADVPLAPDIPEEGRELVLAKLVASLIGVPPDEVFQRAERERRRWTRIRNGVIAALAVLALFSTAAALYARHQLKTNEAFLDATLDRFTHLENRAVALGKSYSVPVSVSLGFLEEAEGMLQVMSEYGRPTPKLKYRRAIMLRAFADNYSTLGRTSEWERRSLEAKAIMTELAALDPGNDEWASELALAHERYGNLLAATGQLDDALVQYTSYVQRMKLLVERDPAASWRQRDLSVAYEKVGDVLKDQGNLPEALKAYRDSLAIRERLAKADPGNAGWQRDFSVSYEKVGDVLKDQGNLTEALKAYRDSLAIAERLAKADPGNAGWQRDLSVAYEKVGDVLKDQGNLTEALKAYRDSLAIRERLAKADPGNAGWQRDLSVAYEKVGDVLKDQGNLPEALKAYRDSLAIRERLAKADPGNAGWQRDFSVSYEKVGDVLKDQGNLTEALKAYRDSLAIAERLAKADPGNAGWQRDLSVAYEKVGDVLKDQGNLTEALKAYRDSLAIRERLAKADPGNAVWQRDLSVSYNKVGDVLKDQGNLTEALKAYRDSLAIRERLAKADPGNAGWQRDLSVSYEKVGDVLMDQGNLPEALKAYRDSLAIAERLAKADPGNAQWQVDVAFAYWRLASFGEKPAETWQKIIDILQRLDGEGRLAPVHKTWLDKAKAQLAALRE